MKKFISIVLTMFMLMSLFTVFVSADGDCDIHSDVNCDDYCDRCNQYAMSSLPGLNATGVITDGVLVVMVFNNGVKSFSSIDTQLHYNSEKLEFYEVDYTQENSIIHAGANFDNIVTASFATAGLQNFPEKEPFILYIATFLIKDELTASDIPELVLYMQDDVRMYSDVTYKENELLCFDTTHTHVDENNDMNCDICTVPVVYIGDMNNDGNITAADARIALRIAAKLQTATEFELYVGDLDGDGRITASEARKILRVAAHIDSF